MKKIIFTLSLCVLFSIGISATAQAMSILEYEWTSNNMSGSDPVVSLYFKFEKYSDVGYLINNTYLSKVGNWDLWTHSDGTTLWLMTDEKFRIHDSDYGWGGLSIPNTDFADIVGDYSVVNLENDYFHLAWGKSSYPIQYSSQFQPYWVFDSDLDSLYIIDHYETSTTIFGTTTRTYKETIHGGTWSVMVDGVPVGAAPVPEPSTFLLLGAGLASLGFLARRRRK